MENEPRKNSKQIALLISLFSFVGSLLVYLATGVYAQNLILVNLILVNFGGFLVIARNPPGGF